MAETSKRETRVVILGAGFGGLAAARVLGSREATQLGVRVTVIDRSNHHLFQPLLYQVATAALSAPDIAAPIRKLLRNQANTDVLMADVARIDRKRRVVVLRDPDLADPSDDSALREVPYDALIVATGMRNAYFGHDAWQAHAPGLKTLYEALDIRNRILRAFEAAERETDEARRRALLTFVVVGAGPTGVELAGALAEIAGRTLARDFRHFDPRTTRVVLLEGGPRVLPTFADELSAKAKASLEKLGVEVRLATRVTDVSADGVRVGEERIDAKTVLWAAGLEASHLTRDLGAPLDRAGRVKVTSTLSLPDDASIAVVGDLVALEQDGKPLPGVAQMAIQSGNYVARRIVDRLAGRPERGAYRYVDKGSMATIGRAKAVAEANGVRMSGFVAWTLWLFIHVLFLVDFRNRIAVLAEWAWSYVTWRRSSRVILARPED